jgi:hypothetical protein
VEKDAIVKETMELFDREEIQRLARQVRWLRRKGRINPLDFLLSLVFGQLSALRLTLEAQGQSLQVPVSRQAIDQRYKPEAVQLFAAVFELVLKRKLAVRLPKGFAPAEQLSRHFKAVELVDTTAFDVTESLQQIYPSCGGAGSAANLKVLMRYEVLQGRLEPLRLLPGKRPDQGLAVGLAQQLKPGELQIQDNGFYGSQAARTAQERGAYWLSPIPHSVSLWEAKADQPEARLDLARVLGQSKEARVEWPQLYLGQGEHRVGPVRVAAIRLSPQSTERRRRALRESMRTKGRTPSQAALVLAEWMILGTNASVEQLPSPMMAALMGLRWQVELVFRQCKWVLRMDQSESRKGERVQCEIWARLLAALVIASWHSHANAMIWANRGCEASFEKVTRCFQQWGHTVAGSFWKGVHRLQETLEDLWQRILKYARKGRQKTRTNTWDRLWEFWLEPEGSQAATG